MPTQVFTVSEVNSYIKNQFTRDYVLSHITISGEVSNLKYHSSGNIFFTLKDDLSQLNAIMFATQRNGLSFILVDGQQIEASGRIAVYEKTGRYQLYVNECRLAGAGLLYEKYLKLKAGMEEMGMFDEIYKKPIPRFCMSIGIVTAASGAAVHDIINVSKRRNPYVRLVLFPAKVQGEGASGSIREGIEKLDEMGLDVLIVGRGGGSIENLWAFNEPEVAYAIFDARTPIISAVGHETDFTIADFVADFRAPTPSAAAEIANFVYDELAGELYAITNGLETGMIRKMRFLRMSLNTYKERLKTFAPQYILKNRRNYANGVSINMRRSLGRRIQDAKRDSDKGLETLSFLMHRKTKSYMDRLKQGSARLESLSPLKKMSGGYGYLLSERKKSVLSIKDVKKGEMLSCFIRDGRIETLITETIPM